MSEQQVPRPLLWAASSKRDLLDMPENVRVEFGHGLYEAQKQDMDLIHSRLKIAEEIYKEWKTKRGKNG